MKFLVDAQLPRRLTRWLQESGHDARHTLDLPGGNASQDAEVVAIADAELRVVVTKDADFVQSFLLSGKPARLLLVSTGNIDNTRLAAIFSANLATVVSSFDEYRFVEITQNTLIVHE